MIRKIIASGVLSWVVLLGVFAQADSKKPVSDAKLKQKAAAALKKDISQAKTYLKAGNNLSKAEQLMEKHLKDSANRNNERLWLIMFDAVRKQYDQGNEKLYLKQAYDTSSFFNLTKKMFTILEAVDSIDARPNSAGVVKPQYRRKHAEFLNDYRQNLFNGGIFFVRKQKYVEAYSFFDKYIDCAIQPLFGQFNYSETDSMMPEAAYWAVYCGYKNQDPKATLHHTYLALKDTAHYCMMLQYLAETYKLENDTVRYLETLNEGFKKYPLFPFFFPRLLDAYTHQGEWYKVLEIAEMAMKKDTASVYYPQVQGTALLNLNRYDECIKASDQLIARNDSLPEPWYSAGMSYFNQAVALDKNVRLSNKERLRMQELYKKAMTYMERFRQLAPDQQERWVFPLYTIYLNLNMGTEFDEIDRLIKKGK